MLDTVQSGRVTLPDVPVTACPDSVDHYGISWLDGHGLTSWPSHVAVIRASHASVGTS